MSQKLCACYTLGAHYLYFRRNAEKFGVRIIGRKIRYIARVVVVVAAAAAVTMVVAGEEEAVVVVVVFYVF
jgi:hypothetical protein